MARDIDNNIESYVKSIKSDIEELKNRQFLGSDNLLIYQSTTTLPTPYDYVFTVAGFGTKRLELTFYGRVQDWFFYAFNADLWYGDTFDEAIKIPFYSNQLQGNIDFGIPKQVTVPFIINNPVVTGETFYIKFYILSTDRGIGTITLREFF